MKLPQDQVPDNQKIICSQENSQKSGLQQSNQASIFVTSEQVRKAIMTISKLKKISKTNQTQIKKKYKEVNQLFCEMSQFFVNKHKKLKSSKQSRQLRSELRKKATLRKKNQQYSKLIGMIAQRESGSSSEVRVQAQKDLVQKVQPELIEDQEVDIKSSTCHICMTKYTEVDDIYPYHCPTCAFYGKEKRFQTANLSGLTALVTGARIKIGYQIALKLLRDGAKVYATTRFIKDALIRYQQQPDYEQFKDRLWFIQCDFVSSEQVISLIQCIKQKVQHLDILIHNAAQTIARPPQFYTFQIENQRKQIQPNSNLLFLSNQTRPSLQAQNNKAILGTQGSQSDNRLEIELKHTDQFGQPLDLRLKNSWREKIEEVSLYDCMSTQVINSTVPFYLTGQLRSIMGGQSPSWIVNVSSMEGVFYRQYKSCFHPHTNMAKASLNMITRTCALELSKDRIYINSVDTGWVTNQNPLLLASKMANKHDFSPPLDCIQGAMRVLDPVYEGIKGNYIYGKFLKNYKQSLW